MTTYLMYVQYAYLRTGPNIFNPMLESEQPEIRTSNNLQGHGHQWA